MARANEEIDEAAPKGSDTVMVGGMDNLIPGGKEAEDVEVEVEVEEPKEKAPRPEKRVVAAADDEEREEDARLAYDTGDDDEIEERGLSRRQRRNRSRKTVVQGRDQVIDALNAKVENLTHMIGQMGQSQVGITVNNIDTQLGAAQQALSIADTEIKKAVAAGDLARYDELTGLKQEAQQRVWQLSQTKQRIVQNMQEGGRARPVPQNGGGQPQNGGGQPQQQAPNLNQRAQDFTETFMNRFDFDPTSTDEQTLIIKAIDDSVAAEGYRPDTPLYWRMLEKKLAARGIYPEDDDQDEDGRDNRREERKPPVRRNGGGRPPTAGGGNNRRGTGTTFRLEPQMREYLEGEGILQLEGLDDQQKARRGRLIKNWQEGMRKLARGEVK